jgi:Protein of unknown function (DUF3105)
VPDGRDDIRNRDRTSNKYAAKQVAQERIAAARAIQQRERRSRQLKSGLAAFVVLAVVGGLVAFGVNHQQSQTKAKKRAATAPIVGVQTYKVASRDHVTTPVTYAQTPPVGGPHNATWLTCGIYDTPVPNENAVHDLEHGAVWITYQPTLPASQIATIRNLALAQPVTLGSRYVTVSPYPGLPSPVVASAWGIQLKLDNASDKRLAEFVDKYRLGPQNLEPGSSCTGGIGSPIG